MPYQLYSLKRRRKIDKYTDRDIYRANLSAHQDRHFLLCFFSFIWPNILWAQKSWYYKITDDPTIQSLFGLIVIVYIFFLRKKKRNKSAKKSITPYIIADGKVNLMLLFVLQCKQNEIIFCIFIYFVVSVPLLYSRCFWNHHNLFYEFRLKCT